MKKSLLLLAIVVLSIALYAVTASAVVLTNTTEWGIDCDTDSSQDVGDITILQSFPGEFNEAIDAAGNITIVYSGNGSSEDVTFDDSFASGNDFDQVGNSDTTEWDVAHLVVADVAVPDLYTVVITAFDTAAHGNNLTTADGFTVPGNNLLASTGDGTAPGTGNDGNCTDDNCIITATVSVTYDGAQSAFECLTSEEVIVAISAAKPDLCSTTLKFPYVVSSTDTAGAYVSALIVTNNASTTCVDSQSDNVNFYAWDEAGNYKGKRGPYKLLGDGEVVIVVDDIDDGSAADMGATAEFIKDTTFANGWYDTATSTWKPWLNADGQVSGRGQVIAIVNQNYSEGYQFLFSLSDSGITGFGTNLAIKDLTNYGSADLDLGTAFVGATADTAVSEVVDAVDYNGDGDLLDVFTVPGQAIVLAGTGAANLHEIEDETAYTSVFSLGGTGYVANVFNIGIISIDSTGNRIRGSAGITDAYYH